MGERQSFRRNRESDVNYLGLIYGFDLHALGDNNISNLVKMRRNDNLTSALVLRNGSQARRKKNYSC
jgi:hypothetical protein